jgi:hypothetical protein
MLENMTAINRTSGLSSRVVIELTKFVEKKTMSILVRNWSTISSLVIPTSAVLSEPTERDSQSHLLNLKLNKGDFKEVILIGLCVGLCWHPFGKIIELYIICQHFLHLRMDSFVRTEKTKAKMGHKTSKPPHRLKSHMLSIWIGSDDKGQQQKNEKYE